MIIYTLIFGVVAYLAVCWIRALQQNKPGSKSPNKTMLDIAHDDFKSIFALFEKKEVKETNEIKPTLRRGSSASNIKNMAEKERNGLVRANSMRTVSYNEKNGYQGSISPPTLDLDSTKSIRRSPSMSSFFAPDNTQYRTSLLLDSSSPFPTEYDAAAEKEMIFLSKSSLDTRSDPEYVNVMSHVPSSLPSWLSSLLSSLSWLLNHRPFRWVRDFIVDILISVRLPVIVKRVPSQPEILQNQHIQNEIKRLIEAGGDAEAIQKRAEKVLDKLAARQKSWVIRVFYVILCVVFRTMFRVFHIDIHGIDLFLKRLQQTDDGVGVVFLPTHKSHIDYLVLSYIAAIYGFPVPMIASGDNLDIPLVGSLFRHSGAFFMRRALGDDTLYRCILEGYVEEVLKSGSTLEFFIEGGRSRDGSILPPKFGLLNVVLDAVKSKRLKDVLLVPIAVDYEHCPDINSYIKYMMGGKKKKESLSGLLKSSYSLLTTDCGDAFVTFGTPMSLQELLKKMEKEDATLDTRHEVKYVGAHICQGMRNNSVVTISSLVAATLLDFPAGEWISEAQLCVHMDQIRDFLRSVGAFEGYNTFSISLLHHFCNNFSTLVEIEDKKYRVKSGHQEQITLLYYRNGLIHHFLADAVVLYIFKALQTTNKISLVDFVPTVDLICRILNAHIPFSNVNSVSAIDSLVNRAIIDIEDDLISLHPENESYVYFCCSLVAPLIDVIWVVSDVIKNLLPSCKQQEVDLNNLIIKSMEITDKKQQEGKIVYPFVENMQMIRNTIEGLVLAGVLSKRKEGAAYLIRLSESYQEETKVNGLHESIDGLRIDLKKIAAEAAALYGDEVELAEDVFGLMVDVKQKKK